MSLALIRSPESVRDLESIVEHYIEQRTPATAIRFGKAVVKTLSLLAEFPHIGSPWESNQARLQDVRFQRVRRFKNHLIFYRVTGAGLYVMRILHGRQNVENKL